MVQLSDVTAPCQGTRGEGSSRGLGDVPGEGRSRGWEAGPGLLLDISWTSLGLMTPEGPPEPHSLGASSQSASHQIHRHPLPVGLHPWHGCGGVLPHGTTLPASSLHAQLTFPSPESQTPSRKSWSVISWPPTVVHPRSVGREGPGSHHMLTAGPGLLHRCAVSWSAPLTN